MARKFTGAARPRGFNPVQVSGANIRRMQEENARILEGMRQRHLSKRRNEEEILRSMKEDSEYARRARDRNYNINKGNIETQIQQSQLDQAADEFQAQERLKATIGITEAIADFSNTAAEYIADQKEKQEKERTAELKAQAESAFADGYRPDSVRAQQKIYDTEAEVIEQTGQQTELAKILGAGAKAANQAHALSLMNSDIGRSITAKNLVELGLKSFSLRWIQENNPEAYGNSEAVQELLPEIWKAFKDENNLNENYTPEILVDALEIKNQIDRNLISGIDAKENQLIESEMITEYTNLAVGNLPEYGALAYRNVSRLNSNYEAGFKLIEKIAVLQNPDGSFLYTEDQVGDLVLNYRGKEKDPEGIIIGQKFRDSNPGRFLEIQNKREDARRDWNRNQATNDRQDYYQRSKQWHQLLTEKGFTPENLAAAEADFQYDIQGVPDWIQVFKASGTEAKRNTTLITIAKDLLARNILPQSMVNEIYKFAPQEAVKLQEGFNEQDPYMANPDYVKTLEIVEGLPLQKNDLGGKGTETAGSLESSKALKEMFVMIFEGHVANGMSMSEAAIRALRDIEEGIRRDAGNPNGTFFRKSTTQLNVFEFPNLIPKNFQSALERAVEEDTTFRIYVRTGAIDQIFANPNSIFTDEQFVKETQKMQQPGYRFVGKVALLAKKLKATPLEIMTKIAETKNMLDLMPPPPPSVQIYANFPSESKALISQHTGSQGQLRGQGLGMQTLGIKWDVGAITESQVPNLRNFYRISAARYGVSPAENSAIGYVESRHGTSRVDAKTGVSIAYNNGGAEGVMQVHRDYHAEFYAEHGGYPSHEANVDYGTKYYAELKAKFDGDMIAAAMSYNGGEQNYLDYIQGNSHLINPAKLEEMLMYAKRFAVTYYAYSGDIEILNHPLVRRN